jgi:hypothetical protein
MLANRDTPDPRDVIVDFDAAVYQTMTVGAPTPTSS